MHRKAIIGIILIILPVLALVGVNTLLAAVPGQEQIESAVVKIIAYDCQRAVDLLCTATETSSGLLVDSRGLIITAYAIVSATQGYADDFEIIINQGAEQRYRATLLEAWADKGMALLLIYYDDTNQLILNKDLLWADAASKFPTVVLGDQAGASSRNGEIIWWPANQLTLVKTPVTFDTTTGTLPISPAEGMIGAPVVAQNEVIGFVTSTNNSNDLQMRWVAEMHHWIWQPATQRVWVEDIIAVQGITETASVQITATLHALDQIAKPLAFLVFVFDEKRPSLPSLVTPFAQFDKPYTPQRFFDFQSIVLTHSLASANVDLAQLRFRFLVWDIAEERVLWRDDGWHRIQGLSVPAIPVPPPPISPPTPLTIDCPEGMESVSGEGGEFCMDIHEVTNAEYAACNACSSPKNVNTRNYQPYYGNPTFDNFPVVSVTWDQADTYCRNANKSLPTAQQWKQGETMVVDRSAVVTQVIAFTDTMPVAGNQQDKSTNSIFDLIGNVREWASDNSQEATSKKNVMGLSYVDEKFPPDSELPETASMDIGFRCVR